MKKRSEYIVLKYILVVFCINKTKALMCYNCSTTHRDKGHCAGDFVKPAQSFNHSRKILSNCTTDETLERSMCFVRSWSARAKHAWIVQRGCYRVKLGDSLPQEMTIPTRAMICKHQRLTDAEYKVCLCQADWCNRAPLQIVHTALAKREMWTRVCLVSMGTLIRAYI